MREQNQPEGTRFDALVDDLKEVIAPLRYVTLDYTLEQDGYRDGFAVLSFPSPYYLSGPLAVKLLSEGFLRDAAARADNLQCFCGYDSGLIRVSYVVRNVWKDGEPAPKSFTLDVNRLIEERIRANRARHEDAGIVSRETVRFPDGADGERR